MSIMTAGSAMTVPHSPRQTPEADSPTTISGFELDEQSRASTSASGQHTPVTGAVSMVNYSNCQVLPMPSQRCCEALEARIEQLLEENELQAQELRDLHNKRREKGEKEQEEEGCTPNGDPERGTEVHDCSLGSIA
jgi:hypothetical protein